MNCRPFFCTLISISTIVLHGCESPRKENTKKDNVNVMAVIKQLSAPGDVSLQTLEAIDNIYKAMKEKIALISQYTESIKKSLSRDISEEEQNELLQKLNLAQERLSLLSLADEKLNEAIQKKLKQDQQRQESIDALDRLLNQDDPVAFNKIMQEIKK